MNIEWEKSRIRVCLGPCPYPIRLKNNNKDY